MRELREVQRQRWKEGKNNGADYISAGWKKGGELPSSALLPPSWTMEPPRKRPRRDSTAAARPPSPPPRSPPPPPSLAPPAPAPVPAPDWTPSLPFASIAVHPPSHYTPSGAPPTPFQLPLHLTSFSYSPTRELLVGQRKDEAIAQYTEPHLGVDLNHGYEDCTWRDDSVDEGLDALLDT